MRIIIAGAGDLGFHLAKLLSHEQQDIVLIDNDDDALLYAATHLDIQAIQGDSASILVLEQAEVSKASLFLAMTTSEKNNLMSCILAKKMGASHTVARVTNQEYLTESQRMSFDELGIDSVICPTQLAAHEVVRLVAQSTVTDLFEFENGQLTLAGFLVDAHSPIVNLSFEEIEKRHEGQYFKPIALQRGDKTIIPRGGTVVRRKDHIYFLTPKNKIEEAIKIVGKTPVKVRNVMIAGGTEVGLKSAQLLEDKYSVVIIEKSKERCKVLAQQLRRALVVHGDPSSLELLKEEGLERMDAFVALTANSETNIITSLLAKKSGVRKTVSLVDNTDYTHISQNIGVDTLINKKLIAANNVFRYVRKGKVEAIASLHGVDAEVIEFSILKENRLTRKPIKDLHFPKEAVVAGVIRGSKSIFPTGNTVLEKGDKVIVFAQHSAIPLVEKLFR